MAWQPVFTKQLGFFSPANKQAGWIASAYRGSITIWPLIPVRYLEGCVAKAVGAVSVFAMISALYYLYAAAHRYDSSGNHATE